MEDTGIFGKYLRKINYRIRPIPHTPNCEGGEGKMDGKETGHEGQKKKTLSAIPKMFLQGMIHGILQDMAPCMPSS